MISNCFTVKHIVSNTHFFFNKSTSVPGHLRVFARFLQVFWQAFTGVLRGFAGKLTAFSAVRPFLRIPPGTGILQSDLKKTGQEHSLLSGFCKNRYYLNQYYSEPPSAVADIIRFCARASGLASPAQLLEGRHAEMAPAKLEMGMVWITIRPGPVTRVLKRLSPPSSTFLTPLTCWISSWTVASIIAR